MAYVVKLLGARPVRLRLEQGEVVVVGRADDADLTLDDKLVSRKHCELVAQPGGLVVRDLQSRNGTALNGRRFRGEALTHPGDQVRVGSHFLLVERDPGAHSDDISGATGALHSPPAAPVRTGSSAVTVSGPIASLARAGSGERGAPRRRGSGGHPRPALPGYEILKELAPGRSGRVYKARSLLSGRTVALKVLDKGASERAAMRFDRAARALAMLDHPNIVKVHEVGDAAGLHYCAMELLEGTPLRRMIRHEPLGAREALAMVVQVARALRLAHAQGVIHRDVSPANILVCAGGVVKLIGFSVVKSPEDADAQGSLTGLGDLVGELAYISPEQARDPRAVDQRSDLYALGAVLYHALAGEPPFGGQNHLEVLRKVLSAHPRRLYEVVPDVPEPIDKIVDKLLRKDPAERFAAASDVERALEDALLGVCGGDSGQTEVGRSFGGGFSGAELLEIAQFLELRRKSGRLVVSAAVLEGEMGLFDGIIVAAFAGQLSGEQAALTLLGAAEGTFRFIPQAAEEAPTAGLGLKPSALVVEIMRARDDRQRAR